MVQLSHLYITTGKTIALTSETLTTGKTIALTSETFFWQNDASALIHSLGLSLLFFPGASKKARNNIVVELKSILD